MRSGVHLHPHNRCPLRVWPGPFRLPAPGSVGLDCRDIPSRQETVCLFDESATADYRRISIKKGSYAAHAAGGYTTSLSHHAADTFEAIEGERGGCARVCTAINGSEVVRWLDANLGGKRLSRDGPPAFPLRPGQPYAPRTPENHDDPRPTCRSPTQ